MKKLLIILLLIVGCAPTKPTESSFYIGMSEQEFIKQNNIDINTETIITAIIIKTMVLCSSIITYPLLN